MTLEEMLEHVAKDWLDDRTELVAGDPDELWSDGLIVRHLNEAQNILCRRSWVIVDIAHPVAGVVPIVASKNVYKLHESILRVLGAAIDGHEEELGRASDAELRAPRPLSGDWFSSGDPTRIVGSPLAFATDTGTRLMRISPTPTAADAGKKILLRVARKPVCPLSLAQLTATPEVPDDWHMAMCKYAAGQCLIMPNTDSDDKASGRALLADWDKVVREARSERERAEMQPSRWGFSAPTSAVNNAA